MQSTIEDKSCRNLAKIFSFLANSYQKLFSARIKF